ncbi:MAG: transglycosylase SLT domain-containing protein [Proteobacteria bacterium]|nr:transglycosylase SLT domain-containing protein [Pseudomonadota bacterium]
MSAAMTALLSGLLLLAVPGGSSAGRDAGHGDLAPAAGLRAARALLGEGDWKGAAELLGEVAERHPIIADHADLLRGRLLLEAGETSAAAGIMLEAAQAHAASPLRADFHELLGDARAAVEDEESARSAWRAALDETRDDERRAQLYASLAASLERTGQPREAGQIFLTLWTSHPTTEQGGAAAAHLERIEAALEAAGEEPLRNASDWRRRGDRLFRKRRNEEALAAYDRALAGDLGEAETQRTQKQRAHTLFRMRRYPEAVEGFAALPQEDDVPLWHARSVARADDVPAAVKEFEALAARSRGALGSRALYLAGLLLDDRGQAAEAREHFRQVAATRASLGLANAARWRLGWGAYREGRYTDAATHFATLIDGDGDAISRLRPRYWRARALDREGDERAGAELAAIAGEFPLSYYGWRARSQAAIDGRPAAAPTAPPPLDPGKSRLAPHELARPRILLEAGMVEEALEETQRVALRARSLPERLEVASLFADGGNYYGAQRIVVDAYTEVLARGPRPNLEELWWHAWPAAYAELVIDATAADGVAPELVYSIMREESGYRPEVVSISGARGLLQIMGTTGERLARDLGNSDFSTDQLFEPRTNIGLGTHYLGELSRRFDGRLPAAVASYNAGPTAVGRWIAAEGQRDDDEWVEAIPYEQTRGYVKRVLRSLHAYQVLY